MSPRIALVVCFVFLAVLFIRDQKNHPKLSFALWIPVIWMFFLGSRSPNSWLHLGVVQVISSESAVEQYAEGNSVDRNVLLLLDLFAAIALARRKLPWATIVNRNRLILFFVLYCLASIAWSEYPFVAFRRWIRFVGIFPVVFIVLSEESPAEAAASVIRRCSYMLVALSFLFIRYYPAFGRYYNIWTYEVGYSGVAGNKNELGLICVVAVMILLSDLTEEWYKRKRIFLSFDIFTWLTLLLVTLYLANIAHSSTAELCIIVGTLIILATFLPSLRRNRHSSPYWIVGAAFFLGMLQVLLDLKDFIILSLGRNPTLTGRTDLWKLLLGMGTNPILGTGFESFWTSKRLAFVWSHGIFGIQSHNGYIDTYLTLGLVGICFFVALLIRCFLIVTRNVEKEYRAYQLGMAFLVVYSLYNYTEAAFPRPGLLLMIFFLFTVEFPQLEEKRTAPLLAAKDMSHYEIAAPRQREGT